MAYPASTQALAQAVADADRLALQVKYNLQTLVSASAAGATSRTLYVDLLRILTNAITGWTRIASMPGIAAYVQEQKSDGNLDVVAEFGAMVTAVTDLRSWIFSAFPVDSGSGAALAETITIEGVRTSLTFSSGALATFRTKSNTVIALIG